jgi:murein L,D-transpeptidase YcbB/YkuD
MRDKRLTEICRVGAVTVSLTLVLTLGLVLSGQSLSYAQVSNFKGAAVEETLQAESSLLVQTGITAALQAGHLGDVKFFDAPGMKAFYEAQNFSPIWVKQSSFFGRKTKTVEAILGVFEESWTHGLNPNHYHIDVIREMMSDLKNIDYFQLDLIVSDALIRYGRDMSAMRVDPKSIGQRSRYWRKALRGIDILDFLVEHDDVETALQSIAPQGALYKKLQDELVQLYNDGKDQEKQKKIVIKDIIRPGAKGKTVLAIRERMGFYADESFDGASYYDDSLVSAVMAFQHQHGLRPDGIVGRQTAKLMNITREDKIDQILVNLERLRWVEQNKPSRYIMVNVPSATLWAVEDGEVVMEMPVVVGRPKRPTNIFSTKVTGIRYNPTWTVPPTIKRDDYLPKLKSDPYYLSDRGIELMDGGQTIDPGTIDWNNKTWAEVNAMRMVQGAGTTNPLGRVRFLMNNPFNIYLHDTTTKSYFKRANRALSSGCIRLQQPIELADFVLKPNEKWSTEKRDAILKKGKMREIYATEPLPVYILYQTVWLGARDQIVYGADIYNHDRKLLKELLKIDGIAVPVLQNSDSSDEEDDLKRSVEYRVN